MLADSRIIEGPLSEANAAALRREFTHLRPVPLARGRRRESVTGSVSATPGLNLPLCSRVTAAV